MTCIASIVTEKGIVMAADRAISNGDEIIISAIPKIFIVHQPCGEPILIGASGPAKNMQILRCDFQPPDDPNVFGPLNHEASYYYVTNLLVPAIREALQQNMAMMMGDGLENFGGCMIIGYRKCIFLVSGDLAIIVSDKPFAAIGGGGQFAIGALEFAFMVKPDKPMSNQEAANILYLALKASAENSMGVEEPIDVLHLVYKDRPPKKPLAKKTGKAKKDSQPEKGPEMIADRPASNWDFMDEWKPPPLPGHKPITPPRKNPPRKKRK